MSKNGKIRHFLGTKLEQKLKQKINVTQKPIFLPLKRLIVNDSC